LENLNRRYILNEVDADGRIILKQVINEQEVIQVDLDRVE
jgi:hypothetical protein